MLKTKNISFPLVWIVSTMFLLFIGMIVASSSGLSGANNLGVYMIGTSVISILIYIFYSAFLWFKFKEGSGLSNFITAYIILALLCTLGGLIGAFLTYPDGLQTFLGGLGMFGLYWFVKLIGFIFAKESDFQ